jgi:hypothetical protein
MQTMTNKEKMKKRRASGRSNDDDGDNNHNNIKVCSAVHITQDQNHIECTLPTSTVAVSKVTYANIHGCQHAHTNSVLPWFIHTQTQSQIFNL